jgi:hypothetical protein
VKALSLNPWQEVSAARIPAVHLEALAPLRDRVDIRVHLQNETAWVCWSGDRGDLVRYLLPVPGVEFFTIRSGVCFRFKHLLPAVEKPPVDDGLPLSTVLLPGAFVSIQPEAIKWNAAKLSIVRCSEPRPTTALICSIVDLQRWADTATAAEISRVKGARAHGRAVLIGSQLPSIPKATRYWGVDVLAPIGFRPEPNLPAIALRLVVDVESDELVFLNDEGAMVLPRKAFEPLSRAGIRLAVRRS